MKKPFKETKGGKILKGLFNGALDVLPIPDLRNYLDKDKNGKINLQDLKQFKGVDYLKLSGAAIGLAAAVKFGLVDYTVVVDFVKLLLGNAG